eukprot:m.111178 g.111178  ORF g.111178 m.111178 type:complete len:386 (-) comp16106_c0_seq1:71-1228(-)
MGGALNCHACVRPRIQKQPQRFDDLCLTLNICFKLPIAIHNQHRQLLCTSRPLVRGRRHKPILVTVMEALKVVQRHCFFLWSASFLEALVADVWGALQVDDAVEVKLIGHGRAQEIVPVAINAPLQVTEQASFVTVERKAKLVTKDGSLKHCRTPALSTARTALRLESGKKRIRLEGKCPAVHVGVKEIQNVTGTVTAWDVGHAVASWHGRPAFHGLRHHGGLWQVCSHQAKQRRFARRNVAFHSNSRGVSRAWRAGPVGSRDTPPRCKPPNTTNTRPQAATAHPTCRLHCGGEHGERQHVPRYRCCCLLSFFLLFFPSAACAATTMPWPACWLRVVSSYRVCCKLRTLPRCSDQAKPIKGNQQDCVPFLVCVCACLGDERRGWG